MSDELNYERIAKEIGAVISEKRKKKKLTQSQLCGNGISVSTLSRIENGLQLPNKYTFDYIFERLGENPEHFYLLFFGMREFEISRKKEEINQALRTRNWGEAERLIKEAERTMEFSSGTNLQFILSGRVEIDVNKRVNTSELMRSLIDAVKITSPDFDITRLSENSFTYQEIKLINMIAIEYAYANELDEAVRIFYGLKDKVEKSGLHDSDKADIYVKIIYNLSKYTSLLGRYNESSELCHIGRKACIMHNKLMVLPYIDYNEGYNLCYKGDTLAAQKLFHQSYHAFIMVGRSDIAEQARGSVKKDFDIDIG